VALYLRMLLLFLTTSVNSILFPHKQFAYSTPRGLFKLNRRSLNLLMLRTHLLGRPMAVIGLPSSDSVPLELVKVRGVHGLCMLIMTSSLPS